MCTIITEAKEYGYTQVANSVICDKRLVGLPMAILLCILREQNRRENVNFCRGYFAQIYGVTEKSVSRAMKVLIDCGYAVRGDDVNGEYNNFTFFDSPQCEEVGTKMSLVEDESRDKNVPKVGTKMSPKTPKSRDKNVPLNNNIYNKIKKEKILDFKEQKDIEAAKKYYGERFDLKKYRNIVSVIDNCHFLKYDGSIDGTFTEYYDYF